MNVGDTLKGIVERIKETAKVDTVYGQPVEFEGKTVIPVAKVRYGFGAGVGEGKSDLATLEGESDSGEGGAAAPIIGSSGGGGGIEANPVGIVEITADETRFISFEDRKRLIRAALVGLLVGVVLLRRWRRR